MVAGVEPGPDGEGELRAPGGDEVLEVVFGMGAEGEDGYGVHWVGSGAVRAGVGGEVICIVEARHVKVACGELELD